MQLISIQYNSSVDYIMFINISIGPMVRTFGLKCLATYIKKIRADSYVQFIRGKLSHNKISSPVFISLHKEPY